MKNIIKTITQKTKAATVRAAMNLSINLSDKNIERMFWMFSKIATDKVSKDMFKEISENAKRKDPFVEVIKKLKNLSPKCRERVIENLAVNAMIKGHDIRNEIYKKEGWRSPFLLVIDVTDRCNLQCPGCWAGTYGVNKNPDMTAELLNRIITEAKQMGTYFINFAGGEPFVRQDLLQIIEKHPDVYFQIYTNGTCITPETTKKLAQLGNATLAISIEGYEKQTDSRRGKGTYKKLMQTMAILKKEGVMFGFSTMVTKHNSELVSSNEYIDHLIQQGCMFGWYFQYIPIGRNPDTKTMSTPEQRNKLRLRVREIRQTKPIFIADFWNDGDYVGGCMAGGRTYLHITNVGDVEPCVFAHFSVDNIKNKSLKEAINSDFFKAFRNAFPYNSNKNLLAPCMIIDNPKVLRGICKQYKAKPTQPGGNAIIKDPKITKFLDKYSKEWKEKVDPVWNNDPYFQKRKQYWFSNKEKKGFEK